MLRVVRLYVSFGEVVLSSYLLVKCLVFRFVRFSGFVCISVLLDFRVYGFRLVVFGFA